MYITQCNNTCAKFKYTIKFYSSVPFQYMFRVQYDFIYSMEVPERFIQRILLSQKGYF